MVKIKDITLASQNRGGRGAHAPRALHTGRPCLTSSRINLLFLFEGFELLIVIIYD